MHGLMANRCSPESQAHLHLTASHLSATAGAHPVDTVTDSSAHSPAPEAAARVDRSSHAAVAVAGKADGSAAMPAPGTGASHELGAQDRTSASGGSVQAGALAGIPFRTAAMCKLDASSKLRRLDELLEVARAKLTALAHGTVVCRGDGGEGCAATAGLAPGGVAERATGGEHDVAAADEETARPQPSGAADVDPADTAGERIGAREGGMAVGVPCQVTEEARRVADILAHVAEASALVQGDLADRLHSSAKRCAQCAHRLASVYAAIAAERGSGEHRAGEVMHASARRL